MSGSISGGIYAQETDSGESATPVELLHDWLVSPLHISGRDSQVAVSDTSSSPTHSSHEMMLHDEFVPEDGSGRIISPVPVVDPVDPVG